MIKTIVIIFALLILILLAVILTRPDEFSYSRSATIDAPPSAVFERVNDFRKWESWSPWADLDPDATEEFEGPESGEGAVFKWSGNNEVGEGRQEIVESRPDELIRIRLDFIRPFAATSETVFTFVPENGGTRVTWSMSGKNNFIAKCMSLFMDCEKMVGSMFDEGLANMKTAAESNQQTR